MTDGTTQRYALTVDKFLLHAAKWHPSGQVVTARGEGAVDRIAYPALLDRARRVSAALAARGVTQGTRVATLAWNTQAHLEAWYAIMGMGAVCHTLNPRLFAAQSAAMLAQSAARVLIASADLAPLVRDILAAAPAIAEVIVIDGPAEAMAEAAAGRPVATLDDIAAADVDPIAWGGFDESAPCGLCFTSGTTGAPKGVSYTHRGNYLHTMRQLQADVSGITARDVVLVAVPMFHANGWGLPFSVPAAGGSLILPGRHADGASLVDLIAEEGVTIGVGVPTVWLGLMDLLDETGRSLPSLERIMVGGAPMPPALMQRIEDRGIAVQTTWGMTELSPLGTAAPAASADRDAGRSGRPAVGVDLMLADSEGNPLPDQRDGEGRLHVRGPSVVERYFGHDEPATRDGWFDTGDLARIDAAGNLTITGRAKDLIKSGGEWINPSEIEAIVGALPQVALAAVIGRPDPKWGERPILLVETRDGAPLADDDLLAPLRGRVAPWWIPDAVIHLGNMPLASTGKIDKIRLRSEYGRV
ncbi:AMP-binding protein [Allosphingosinicella indica]|uniref:Fatty-acyl-CoA synthase n=1 Tax=Allosphingosinicella indica TaxID=941907 RepID=A0A1X7GDR1_9SPHN|nr:AMP-binding protein [Allosphingosinicella indica]SMF67752.1 fatty-acyl-CoA synthase [Allosphingosinicella indica]